MKQIIVGLLPVDPHRLHVYWDAPRRKNVFLLIEADLELVPSSGSRYIGNLQANQSYQAALYAGSDLLMRSNVVTLPPDRPAPDVQPPVVIASASQ